MWKEQDEDKSLGYVLSLSRLHSLAHPAWVAQAEAAAHFRTGVFRGGSCPRQCPMTTSHSGNELSNRSRAVGGLQHSCKLPLALRGSNWLRPLAASRQSRQPSRSHSSQGQYESWYLLWIGPLTRSSGGLRASLVGLAAPSSLVCLILSSWLEALCGGRE